MRRSRPDRRVSELARGIPGVAFGSVVLASGLVAGCGSGGAGRATPKLPAAAVSVMNAHLEHVSAAAGSHDRAGATREIDAFATDVAQQKAAGHLSSADYTALETGIARTRSRIGVEVLVPSTPEAPAPVSVAPSQPVPQIVVRGVVGQGTVKVKGAGNGKGDGAKQGKGGKGKGDGGD